jgi:RHS repeat-associated protein
MSFRAIRIFLIGLVLSGVAFTAIAQVADQVHIPIQLTVTAGYDQGIIWEYHGFRQAIPRASKINASLASWSRQYSLPGGTFDSRDDTLDDFQNYRYTSPPEYVSLEMGVEYVLNLSRTNEGWLYGFAVTPPPGMQILVNGLASKSKSLYAASGSYKIRVLPALEGQSAPIGAATEFQPGQVKWAVSLGNEKNGDHLGYAWIIGAGTGTAADAWDTFLSPANLYCDKNKDSDDLYLYRAAGYIRQIRTPQAFIDVIPAVLPSGFPALGPNVPATIGAAYEMRFYHPAAMTTSGSLRTPLTASTQPFLVYRVIDDSAAAAAEVPADSTAKRLRIEKLVCNPAENPARQILHTEYTSVMRRGSSDTAFVWTATGWTFSGQTPIAKTLATWTPISGGHREVMQVLPASGSGGNMPEIMTDYVSPSAFLPRMAQKTIQGAASMYDKQESRVTSYADHTTTNNVTVPDTTKRYRFGLPQISSTGAAAGAASPLNGPWNAFMYLDPANYIRPTTNTVVPSAERGKWIGVVAASFSPFKDTEPPVLAANAEPAPGPGILATYYDYTKDAFGYPSRVTLIETYHGAKTPANLIAKSQIAYSAATLNLTRSYQGETIIGLDCVKALRTNYSSSGSTVVSSLTYAREDEITGYLRGQAYAEVATDGSQVSYSRRLGTYDPADVVDTVVPLSFSSTATGPCNRIAMITGSSVAGPDTESTAYSSDQGSDIVNLYLIPGHSTQTYHYRDKYARLVRTESYIRTSGAVWELVAWKNYYYNTRSQLVKVTDSQGSIHELFYNFSSTGATLSYFAAGPEGEYLTREVDAGGVEIRYSYDKAGRLVEKIRKSILLPGDTSRPDLVTTFTYDEADRVTEEKTYAANAPDRAFVTARTYDSLGRVLAEKSSGSSVITSSYDSINRQSTITNSITGATRLNEVYRDGQPKSATVNGILAASYDYGFDTQSGGDGYRWTEVTTVSIGSPRKTKSWTDWLGRSVRGQSPAPPGITGPLVTQTFYGPQISAATYNTANPPVLTAPAKERGLPIRVTSPGSTSSMLSTYGSIGQPLTAGLDADLSGDLESASSKDRITGTRYTGEGSAYSATWSASETYTYANADSAEEAILGKTWTRLNGWSAGLIADTMSWDAEGNLTRRSVTRDRATRKVTVQTWAPGLALPAIEESIDGLVVAVTSPDQIKIETFYDDLRRPIKTRSPKTGSSGVREVFTTYQTESVPAVANPPSPARTDATSLVLRTVDAEDHGVEYAYDAALRPHIAKRITGKTGPDTYTYGPTTQQAYDVFGRVTHVFGTAVAPVKYVYNDYGERTKQLTFRGTSKTHFATLSDFPANETGPEIDIVQWDYDPATGLLLTKTDPLGRLVKYEYDDAGRIKKRYWARHKNSNLTTLPTSDADRLAATPTYDPATGDLLSTSYNDGVTPAVSTTYDRAGRPLTITDAAGTRSFLRDLEKPWRTLAEVLPAHYGAGRTLTWLYEDRGQTSIFDQSSTFGYDPASSAPDKFAQTTGIVSGRSLGIQFGTLVQPAAFLQHTTAYDAAGRLKTVTAARDSSGIRQSFVYTYTANSRLLDTLSAPGTNFTLKRTWDPLCDDLTKIETLSGNRALATYEYTHNALGQRDRVVQSGEAFAAEPGDADVLRTSYLYDNRGQLSSARSGLGATLPDALSAWMPGRQFTFGYDLAGNRVASDHQSGLDGSAPVSYTVGKGNQLLKRDNPVASVSGQVSMAVSNANIAVETDALQNEERLRRYWQKDLALSEGSKLPAESAEQTTGRDVPDDQGTTAIPKEYPRKGKQITTVAGIPGGGAGGADLAAFDRVDLWLSPRDEQLRYDRDGNLLRDGTWAYTWDAENRLIKMENHPWLLGCTHYRLQFKYDYQGRRISKTVETKQPTETLYGAAVETRYLYDGWNLIAELQPSGGANPPSLLRSYAWGLDIAGSFTASGGVGALLQITDHSDGQSYFPGYDGNGNVSVLVRASDGFRAAAYEYGPFGELLRAEGLYAAKNPFRFSTKFTDSESGLVYYGFRYYDARNGRFINRDPIEERGGLNLYGFCGNDGVNRYDVLGMSWFSKLFKKIGKFFKKYWRPILAIAVGVLTGGIAAFLAPAAWSSMAVGALAGGVGGFSAGVTGAALSGASFGDSLKAGLIGGTIGAISGGILGKLGTMQGFSTDMKFSVYLRKMTEFTAVGATASGAGAELSGGNFGDGFKTGAAWSAGAFVVTAGFQTYRSEQGETVFPEGASQDTAQYRDVTTNGIMGDRAGFQQMVTSQRVLGYYNPSQGILNDVMQSTFQKLLFGWGDSLANGFSNLTARMIPGPLNITAHSQGTLTVTNAILRGGVPDGSTLTLKSPAISYPRAWLAAKINGSAFGTSNYVQPWGDGAAMWSPSLNPVKAAYGATDIFSGFGVHRGNYP